MKKFIKRLIFLSVVGAMAASVFYAPQLHLFYLKKYYQDYKKENPEIALKNAQALYKAERYGELLDYLGKMNLLYPGNVDLRRIEGLALIKTGDRSRGARLVIATMKKGDDIGSVAGAVEVLFEEGEYHGLAALLSKHDVGRDPFLAYVYGISLYRTGALQRALPYLLASRNMGRNDYDIHYAIGSIFEKTGNTREAAASYEQAYRLDTVRKEARDGLIRCYRALKQFDKAGKLIRPR